MSQNLFFRTAIFCLVVFLVGNSLKSQSSKHVELLAQLEYKDERHSGSWIYSRSENEEYALVGAFSGTVIFDMETYEYITMIEGPGSNWREITVIGDYAYVVTEGSRPDPVGMQIIDLSQLPDTATLVTQFTSEFLTGHMIQRDVYTDEPIVYVMGTNSGRGVHIIDVSNPQQPKEIGRYQPGHYIHDAHIKNNQLFACAINDNTIDIVDISDKRNPEVQQRIDVQDPMIHSCWLTEDNNYLVAAYERDGVYASVWDVRDPNNIEVVSRYSANLKSLVHNPYVLGDFAHISHNTEGYRVLDISDPVIPVEVGHYDTYDGPSGGFSGLWSACPYSKSGKVIGGDRFNGLYIWQPTLIKAGRNYITIIDSKSKAPIFDAQFVDINNGDTLRSTLTGEIHFGGLPGSYPIELSADGYDISEIQLELEEGITDTIVLELNPSTTLTDQNNAQLWTLSPNPSTEKFTVLGNSVITNIVVYNSIGSKITEQSDRELTVANWPSGIYFVIINHQTIKKVMVAQP